MKKQNKIKEKFIKGIRDVFKDENLSDDEWTKKYGDKDIWELTWEKVVKPILRQTLQRFIEETRIKEIELGMDEDCPFCGKKKWECETELAIDKEIEFEKLNEFDCHRITYNQLVRKFNQKQAKWLKENLYDRRPAQ